MSEFTMEELARLNQIISIALLSRKVEFDEISRSVHQKITCEICRRAGATEAAGEEG